MSSANSSVSGSPAPRPIERPKPGRSQIEEMIAVVSSMLFGMWRYRWPALLLAWCICVVGWGVVYSLPDVYRASTRIYVDTESMIKRAVGDLTVNTDLMSEINVLTRAMLSEPQLEKTALKADLDLQAPTREARDRLIIELGRRITVTKEGADIFRITFEDRNRETAEKVVKTLLDTFVEDALGARRTDSGAAAAFVEQQIQDYERRLNDAEEKLASFKRENIGVMPGDSGDYYTRMQRAIQVLAETREQLRLATERKAEYEKQLAGEEPVFGIVAPAGEAAGLGTSTDAAIAKYENDLNALLLRYTDNHPDVIALRETIARLKEQRAADLARLPPAAASVRSGGAGLEANPVYQKMRMGLSDTEVDIATLRSKIASQEATVRDLQKMVDTIPETERHLNALNRDYSVTKAQYEALLKRRESLRMTGEVEQTGDELNFRTIDPPRAALVAAGPRRSLFLTAVMMLAVGAGAGLAFLLQQVNPMFATRGELRDLTGLPVLGAISLIQGHEERSRERRRALVFGAAAAALPIALAFAVAVQGPAHSAARALLSAMLS